MKKVLVLLSLALIPIAYGATTDAGAKSPDALFKTLKSLDRSDQTAAVSCIAPDERYLLSFSVDFGAGFMFAFSKDKALKNKYQAVRAKYKLPDNSKTKVDPKNQEALMAYAQKTYKDIDHAAFVRDMSAVMSKIEGVKNTVKPAYKDMKNLKVAGSTATATAVTADGKSEDISFVKQNGKWYLSIKGAFAKK